MERGGGSGGGGGMWEVGNIKIKAKVNNGNLGVTMHGRQSLLTDLADQ